MRLRRKLRHDSEGPETSEPQADPAEQGEIADGALTRERRFVEEAHPLDETGEPETAPTAARRRDGWRRRGRSEAAESDGVAPEVLSRLSKYRLTPELLARQESRREADEEEPWRKG